MSAPAKLTVASEATDGDLFAPTMADIIEGENALEIAVTLISMHYEIIQTLSRRAYALPRFGPRIAIPLDVSSDQFVDYIAHEMHRYKKRANNDVIQNAIRVLRAKAEAVPLQDLPVRAFENSGVLYIDIGDETGNVIAVSESEWTILDQSPISFRRTELSAPLPQPIRGGDVARVFDFVNIADEDKSLFLGCLLSAYEVSTARPLLLFQGEQGSGKTQNAKIFVALTDPSLAPTRALTQNVRDWQTMLPKSSVIALDNVTKISREMSDAMCQASTGSGTATRSLYTDDKAIVSNTKVMQVITTIALDHISDDLMDRSVLLSVPTIAGRRRATEVSLQAMQADAMPAIFGGILDLMVRVRAAKASVAIDELPRMADFAVTLAAVDLVRGSQSLSRYAAASQQLVGGAVSESPLLQAILDSNRLYEGTVATILKEVRRFADSDEMSGEPRYEELDGLKTLQLGLWLKKAAPSLRKLGWTAEYEDRNTAARRNYWWIGPPGAS